MTSSTDLLEKMLRLGLRGRAEFKGFGQAAQALAKVAAAAVEDFRASIPPSTNTTAAEPGMPAESVQHLATSGGQRCELRQTSTDLRIVMRAMGLQYEAYLPFFVTGTNLPTVTVSPTSDLSKDVPLVFKGLDAFTTDQVPAVFQDVHAKAMAELRRIVPEELLIALALMAQPATPATPAPAQEATPTSPPSTEAPDVPASTPSKRIVLVCDNGPDHSFEGDLIAQLTLRQVRGRTQIFRIYETKGGAFIGSVLEETLWPGERQRQRVALASTVAELAPFFGYSVYSKQLFAGLGVDIVKHVE